MSENNSSIFEIEISPIKQGLIVLSGAFLLMLISKIISISNLINISPRFPWLIVASLMMFFAIFNSILSVSSKNMNEYWKYSIYSYIGFVALASGLAYLFSNISIYEAGSTRWIFFVLTFGYLVFLSIMRFMRKIIQVAQKEDSRMRGEE